MGSTAIALRDADAELVQIRKGPKHPRSLGTAPLTRAEREEVAELEAQLRAEGAYQPMPRTRGECPPAGTVCPHIKCGHHLALHIARSGAVKVTFYRPVDVVDLEAMPATCSLQVADQGPHTYAAIGRFMDLTLEAIRRIEVEALAKLKRKMKKADDYPPAIREMIERRAARRWIPSGPG
jgi:hypothetical protein